MPSPTSTAAAGTTFAGVVNNGYVSDYFLAYRISTGFDELFKAWDAAERNGDPTARGRVRGLSRAFDALRLDAVGTQPDPDDANISPKAAAVVAQRELNDAVLVALGWGPQRTTLNLMHADSVVEVPAAHVHTTASGTLLVALDTVFATDPEVLVAGRGDATGRLLEPLTTNGRPVATTLLEAAQVIFTSDDAPTYLLGCAGGAVVLLDRARWGEGIYLGADLDGALARRDDAKRGELAVIAALLSADSLDPGTDAQSAHDRMLERATSEAVGVNKELRHGVRRSVELLAQAVVADVRHRQHGAWQQIDPDELTRQCLRYLYRIIVLLFAEARPELAILPVDERYYRTGYSIARLRELALVDLDSETSRNATHIQDSLAVLFDLVDGGYAPDNVMGEDAPELTFPGLHAGLFADTACPMLDRAKLSDATLQQVLANLCFTRPRAGQPRRSLSYATLGINQLGAVYEGLMAYRGRLADAEYFEVDNDGDPDTGTWLVRADAADEYPDDVFVTEEGPDGQPRRVRYTEGDFIFRLAGRDRQRSASFYTPEVLTEFTVRHALDVYEEGHPGMTPADWLAMTVCEPALGSGAFANEAINQLAARYLKAAQEASGETIDADRYQLELQKAKAHFAINRTYGVDLNRTAVELAEVSLWLNCMHDGLAAPDFSARLRRGNSLIGCRRASYTPDQVEAQPWKGSNSSPVVPPTPQALSEVPLGSSVGIHHFLVPGEGWGSAALATELKGTRALPGLAVQWAESVGAWRTRIHRKPNAAQIARLEAIAKRVEVFWEQAANDVATFLNATEQRVGVWGATDGGLPSAGEQADSGVRYRETEGPAARLRLVMDAWCALWMWAPEHGTDLPSFEEWLDVLELLFGQPDEGERDTLFSPVELHDGSLESIERFGKASVAELMDGYGWLAATRGIAAREAFFHWELDFAPVFSANDGGFDLQVGNPPWVRPTWDEPASLAEHDPWWGLTDLRAVEEGVENERRLQTLSDPHVRDRYLRDRSESAGLNAFLSSRALYQQTAGLKTNTYFNFMLAVWRHQAATGVAGLVHQDAHLTSSTNYLLRLESYLRLVERYHFINELRLFEIHHEEDFSVNIYGSSRPPDDATFLQVTHLYHPRTADRSLRHDGDGETPGLQLIEGGWDHRPHQARVVVVSPSSRRSWARLIGQGSSDAPTVFLPLTAGNQRMLERLAGVERAIGDLGVHWTRGFDQTQANRRRGTIVASVGRPRSLQEAILSAGHILNGFPLAQDVYVSDRGTELYRKVSVEHRLAEPVPLTSFQWADAHGPASENSAWGSRPASEYWRVAYRASTGSVGGARTLQVGLLPPGPSHTNTIGALALESEDLQELVLLAGLMTSMPYDYLVKVLGTSNLNKPMILGLPMPRVEGAIAESIVAYTLLLNAVSPDYAPLWNQLRTTVLSLPDETLSTRFGRDWTSGSPLKGDYERWQASVALDVLGALALGLDADDLIEAYRSQFGVLRRYEAETLFDAQGNRLSRDREAYGCVQAAFDAAQAASSTSSRSPRIWDLVQRSIAGETNVDLGPFDGPFLAADRESLIRAVSDCYRDRCSSKP